MHLIYSFIGVGNMARAILRSMDLLEGKQRIGHTSVILCNRTKEKILPYLDAGYQIADTDAEAAEKGDVIFLCVKPQDMKRMLSSLRSSGVALENKVFVSVAAGISIAQIRDGLGTDCAVIRTMPNTPMQIGAGTVGICRNEKTSAKVFEQICRIFSASSALLILNESQMNTVIGATGSSPAYVYRLIDAICRTSRAQGLDNPQLLKAVCETVIGSARMILESGLSPEELIREVRSPGGTTEQAMLVFDNEDFDGLLDRAIRACNARADELGNSLS